MRFKFQVVCLTSNVKLGVFDTEGEAWGWVDIYGSPYSQYEVRAVAY